MRHKPNLLYLSLILGMSLLVGRPIDVGATEPATPQGSDGLDEVTVDLEMPFPDNPERVVELLQRVEEDAIDIRQDAERVLAFVILPAHYTWLTHRWRLSGAEETLEDLQEGLSRLESRADMLLDGQRAALDRMRPAADRLDTQIEEAIQYLDRVRGREFGPRYTELAQGIRDEAEVFIDASRLAESLTEVREHLEALKAEQ